MASPAAPLHAMTTSRDTPNPLRPYYVPPSIGTPPGQAANSSAAGNASSHGGFGASAKSLLSEFDYGGPLLDREGPSVGEIARKILDQALWKYTSVLLSQPFDVAKTILQVRIAAASDAEADAKAQRRTHAGSESDRRYSNHPLLSGSESSDEEPSYFTPTKPHRSTSRYEEDESPSRQRSRRRRARASRSGSSTPVPPTVSNSHKLNIARPDSIMDTLSQLWQHSGATGLWKATNASFIHNVLAKAIESWTRSLLSALLNLPDPSALVGSASDITASALGGLNVTDSPSPLTSLVVAVAASGIAGLLLAPLDLVRTRLILTPTMTPPRAILPSLRLLPSLTLPTSLIPLTVLHSSIPTLITSSAPLLLRQYLHIDPVRTPSAYSLSTFLASTAEIFLKLPVETVLRRAQVHILRHHHKRQYEAALHRSFKGDPKVGESELKTVVDVGPYNGLLGTMWLIAREEGTREPKQIAGTPIKVRSQSKKGQGVQGLWRGWRVGMWGLVGVWGASALGGGSGAGSEF